MPRRMKANGTRAARGASYLTHQEFEEFGALALGGVGWKGRLCSLNGVQKSSMTRWSKGETPIPKWLAVQLILMRRWSCEELMMLAGTSPVEAAVPRMITNPLGRVPGGKP